MGMLTGKHKDRSYLDDYQINEEGQYEYQGTFYRWEEPKKRKGVQQGLWLRLTAAAVLMLAAGCIPAPGVNHAFYLLLPYAAGLGCCIWSAMALGRMCAEADPMREHVFQTSAGRLPVTFLLACAAALICVIAEVVHLIGFNTEGSLLWGLVFILLEAAAAWLLLTNRRKMNGLTWKKVEKLSE